MRRNLIFAALMISLIGCEGHSDPKMEKPSLGYLEVQKSLRGYSSRVLDGLAVQGRHEAGENFNQSECEAGSESQKVTHFWQVEDVSTVELRPAIERLRHYLESQGWGISDFANPPETDNSIVSANSPDGGYHVRAMGVKDLNRVAVQVSSPCVKLPKGGS